MTNIVFWGGVCFDPKHSLELLNPLGSLWEFGTRRTENHHFNHWFAKHSSTSALPGKGTAPPSSHGNSLIITAAQFISRFLNKFWGKKTHPTFFGGNEQFPSQKEPTASRPSSIFKIFHGTCSYPSFFDTPWSSPLAPGGQTPGPTLRPWGQTASETQKPSEGKEEIPPFGKRKIINSKAPGEGM